MFLVEEAFETIMNYEKLEISLVELPRSANEVVAAEEEQQKYVHHETRS
jgi:hypothetical protein